MALDETSSPEFQHGARRLPRLKTLIDVAFGMRATSQTITAEPLTAASAIPFACVHPLAWFLGPFLRYWARRRRARRVAEGGAD